MLLETFVKQKILPLETASILKSKIEDLALRERLADPPHEMKDALYIRKE